MGHIRIANADLLKGFMLLGKDLSQGFYANNKRRKIYVKESETEATIAVYSRELVWLLLSI